MEHSKNFPDSFYRVTVKGLCVRDGKVLLIREAEKISGKWEMPGGGLDFGEDIQEGFKREVKEETGMEVVKMSKSPVYVYTYKYENRRNIEWYYSCVLVYRIEFKDLNLKPTDEACAMEFFSKDQLKNLQFDGQSSKLPEIFNPEDFEGEF